jgi:hypothetical protein
MVEWFEQFPLLPGALLVVGGFVLLSVVMARLTHNLTRKETFFEHNDLAGFIFAVVGVIYAVLLGFIAIGVWDRFAVAEGRTFDEAAQLTIVYRYASDFPAEQRELRQEIRDYVGVIVEREWPAMLRGRANYVSDVRSERLAEAANSLRPKDLGQGNVQRAMIDALAAALVDRDERLSADATGLNALMWAIVICGAFITIAFSYLFSFRRTALQSIMIGGLSLLIGLIIFLTMSLDYPYRGSIRVGPEAFERALSNFDAIDRTDARRG